MGKNSGNQIRNKMIQSFPKTDCEKLGGLETFLHETYPDWDVKLEHFMLFTKGEDEFVGIFDVLDEEQVNTHVVHPPDFWIELPDGRSIVLELDGAIHDIKTMKTSERNRRFELNNLDYHVVNEADLKMKLGVKKSNPLSQDQINQAFKEKLDSYVQNLNISPRL